jgi:hypothetical protein
MNAIELVPKHLWSAKLVTSGHLLRGNPSPVIFPEIQASQSDLLFNGHAFTQSIFSKSFSSSSVNSL